jgi:hypothetical protein
MDERLTGSGLGSIDPQSHSPRQRHGQPQHRTHQDSRSRHRTGGLHRRPEKLPPRASSVEESSRIREPDATPSARPFASPRAAGLSWSLGVARRREQQRACIGPPPWAGTGSSREPRLNGCRHASEAACPHAQVSKIQDARGAGHRRSRPPRAEGSLAWKPHGVRAPSTTEMRPPP